MFHKSWLLTCKNHSKQVPCRGVSWRILKQFSIKFPLCTNDLSNMTSSFWRENLHYNNYAEEKYQELRKFLKIVGFSLKGHFFGKGVSWRTWHYFQNKTTKGMFKCLENIMSPLCILSNDFRLSLLPNKIFLPPPNFNFPTLIKPCINWFLMQFIYINLNAFFVRCKEKSKI